MNKLVETKLRKLIQKEIKSVLKENDGDVHELVDKIDSIFEDFESTFSRLDSMLDGKESYNHFKAIHKSINTNNSNWDKWKANYL